MDWVLLLVELVIGGGVGFAVGRLMREMWPVLVGVGVLGLLGILFLGYAPQDYVEMLEPFIKPVEQFFTQYPLIAAGFIIGLLAGLLK